MIRDPSEADASGLERWRDDWAELLDAVREVREVENGYELSLPCDPRWIREAGALLAEGHQRDRSLRFELIADAEPGPIRLQLLAPPGERQRLRREVMGLFA